MYRTVGGWIAGGLFFLPGVIAIMVSSIIYAVYGHVGVITGLFFGLKAAVLAIVLDAVIRVGKRALKNNWMVTLAGVAFVAIYAFGAPFPLIVLTAAVIGFFGGRAGLDTFKGGGHGSSGKEDG